MSDKVTRNHRDMWLWLSAHPNKLKRSYFQALGFDEDQIDLHLGDVPRTLCFLCEKHYHTIEKTCPKCPLHERWRNTIRPDAEGCMNYWTTYRAWQRCHGLVTETPTCIPHPNKHMAHIHAARLAEAETWSNGRYTA